MSEQNCKPESNIARAAYHQWRTLRNDTAMHNILCDCSKCSQRRRLGAKLVLPYAGAPRDFKFKTER